MSLFTLFACADLAGDKVNFELGFNGRPSLHDLHVRVVEVFTVALYECGETGSFRVAGIVLHDRRNERWDDLRSESQLSEGLQLYVFQPGRRSDDSRPIPKPMLPPPAIAPSRQATLARSRTALTLSQQSVRSASSSPRAAPENRSHRSIDETSRSRRIILDESLETPPADSHLTLTAASQHSPSDAGHGNQSDDLRSVTLALFAKLDTDKDGLVSLRQLHDTMENLRMDTGPAAVGDTFDYGDRTITAADFVGFGEMYPATAEELLSRVIRAHPSAVASTSAPSAPSPTRGNGVATVRRRASPPRSGATARPPPPPPQHRPVSPAPSAPVRRLDSHVEPPPVRADSGTLRPSQVEWSAIQLERPLSAMGPAELDDLEGELLRLLEETRRKRAAFAGVSEW